MSPHIVALIILFQLFRDFSELFLKGQHDPLIVAWSTLRSVHTRSSSGKQLALQEDDTLQRKHIGAATEGRRWDTEL